MVLTEKRKNRIRHFAAAILIILVVPLCERGKDMSGASTVNAFAGKELICAIDLGDDMYSSNGLETGFNYELLGRFAKDNRCSLKIVAFNRHTDYIDSLKTGRVDIVITHDHDLNQTDGIGLTRKVDEYSVWAVNTTNRSDIRQMNSWISHITASSDFSKMQSRYRGTFNPHKRAEKGVVTSVISPYDNLIRKHAKALGWDWRMLAAVIYQESKFSINSTSHRGAKGLMQIMPQTGRYYGVEDLLNPDSNIEAGVKHLKRLQNLLKDSGMDKMEMVKFTLAAYNAGEGRIADCRNFASEKGYDRNSWDEIQKIIPLMREDSILNEPSVKLGKFQGYETITYVDSILKLYDSICAICPAS